MKLIYTDKALESLQESLDFLASIGVPFDKILSIRDQILAKADLLLENPESGQLEERLKHLGKGHRRLIESHYKIIYRVAGENVVVTDIFDSRQDPQKMKD